jgi:hypothetical protein
MYKLSIDKKYPIFFNTFVEFRNKVYEDVKFADSLFDTAITLQKVDSSNPNVHYDIERGHTNHGLDTYPSDFDDKKLVFENTGDNHFTIFWRQSKDNMEYCYMTVYEWVSDVGPHNDNHSEEMNWNKANID